MSDKSSISWCDATWTPVLGCTRVSDGCTRCYAEQLSARLERFGQATYRGLTNTLPNGEVRWSGTVRTLPERLDWPLKWKTPRRIFVTSMADLFHEQVPDSFLDAVWAVMGATPHTYQVLTKRPERMLAYCARHRGPLPNVWLGTSVEHQAAADERIPLLLQTPAAVRFLSCEPLLGPVVLPLADGGIHWVIVGGESGRGYRPLQMEWLESIVEQCQAAGVPVWVKQDSGPRPDQWGRIPERLRIREFPRSELPTTEELRGIDPEYTGDLSSAEYLERVRGGGSGPHV